MAVQETAYGPTVVRFPEAGVFPQEPPREVPEWMWQKFLGLIGYRDHLLERARNGGTRNPREAGWLRHEIKRTEIDAGLWLGRMQEGQE